MGLAADFARAVLRSLGGSTSVSNTSGAVALEADRIARYVRVSQRSAADAAAATATTESVLHELTSQNYGDIGAAAGAAAADLIELCVTPSAAVTASDTTYATFTFSKRDNAGANKTTVATMTTQITGGTGNMTAFVGYKPTITQANARLVLGGCLTWEIAKASTGVQLPQHEVQAVLRRV